MRQRNWLDLSRKLVDRYDLDFTLKGMSEILGEYALTFFGVGVLKTTTFPNPFPITLSGALLGGTVGTGIAYDPEGNYTSIPENTGDFVIPAADNALERWDLLVIRYKQSGYDQVPKPSDPIVMVDLNLKDDYELAVVPGVPALAPAYPAKGALDVILSGVKVPANAAVGTNCFIDLSIREVGIPDTVKFPSIVQELLTGVVDGVNTVFTTSQEPSAGSLILTINGTTRRVTAEWSIVGNTITFVDPPELGQTIYGWYIYNDASSVNPLAAQQEQGVGASNGINDTFALTGMPANQTAMLVWKDGILIPNTKWSLTQNANQSFIKMGATEIPEVGQDIYVWYLVNPASVGIAPQPPLAGDGSFTPIGTILAPVAVGPGGYVSTADQRVIAFITSTGGVVDVVSNPQITAGLVVGQELVLKGTSDVNYPVFEDGDGLSLNGAWEGKAGSTLYLFWDGAVWEEISRR